MPVNLTPSKPQPKPARLTADEHDRLARYEATPAADKSEAELLDQLRLSSRAMEWYKFVTAQTIRDLLPKDGTARRGLITEVTDASPYKREYVARIRDGIAANYHD